MSDKPRGSFFTGDTTPADKVHTSDELMQSFNAAVDALKPEAALEHFKELIKNPDEEIRMNAVLELFIAAQKMLEADDVTRGHRYIDLDSRKLAQKLAAFTAYFEELLKHESLLEKIDKEQPFYHIKEICHTFYTFSEAKPSIKNLTSVRDAISNALNGMNNKRTFANEPPVRTATKE